MKVIYPLMSIFGLAVGAFSAFTGFFAISGFIEDTSAALFLFVSGVLMILVSGFGWWVYYMGRKG